MTTVASIIDDIKRIAQQKSAEADKAFERSAALARKIVGKRLNKVVEKGEFPEVFEVERNVPDYNMAEARKDAIVADVTNKLTATFNNFFAEYMPMGSAFDAVDGWLSKAIAGEGSGLSTLLEDQIFERDRQRLLRDKWRQETELRAQWAARRYPMPPGAMDYQLMQLNRDINNKIADSSRERALATFQAEIENMRSAVTQAIALRTAAIDRAITMFTAWLEIDRMGTQYQQQFEQQRVATISALTSLYAAEQSGWQAQKNLERGNLDLAQQDLTREFEGDKVSLEQEVAAAMQAAQAAATQAAAALNGLHAQGSVSYSESKQLEE